MNWESYACRFVLGVLLTVCLACVGVVRPSFVDGKLRKSSEMELIVCT